MIRCAVVDSVGGGSGRCGKEKRTSEVPGSTVIRCAVVDDATGRCCSGALADVVVRVTGSEVLRSTRAIAAVAAAVAVAVLANPLSSCWLEECVLGKTWTSE